MNERTLQFRVGVFVLFAAIVAALLIVRFGEMPILRSPIYTLSIRFPNAPGVETDVPVRISGIRIGRVRDVRLDDGPGKPPGVTVIVEIEQRYALRSDSQPVIARTLLGDASIEFVPGKADTFLQPNAELEGSLALDPLAIVQDLGGQISQTLKPWESVGGRLDRMLANNEGKVDQMVEQLAASLKSFDQTMQNANALLADPENQENFRRTLQETPKLIADARETVAAIRGATESAQASFKNLEKVTEPLAEHSKSVVEKLDIGATRANELLTELTLFAQALHNPNGSLAKLMSNPNLYNNLDSAAFNLNQILLRLQTASENLEVFSDTVARFPEILGLGGVMQPSSGLKLRTNSVLFRGNRAPTSQPQRRPSATGRIETAN
ncbi:MAG: MCE family protein [Planctomycetes bacterium]|nr:MCE family protein [Planctomycetota bacterium]